MRGPVYKKVLFGIFLNALRALLQSFQKALIKAHTKYS